MPTCTEKERALLDAIIADQGFGEQRIEVIRERLDLEHAGWLEELRQKYRAMKQSADAYYALREKVDKAFAGERTLDDLEAAWESQDRKTKRDEKASNW